MDDIGSVVLEHHQMKRLDSSVGDIGKAVFQEWLHGASFEQGISKEDWQDKDGSPIKVNSPLLPGSRNDVFSL